MSCILGGVSLDHTPLWVERNKYHDALSESVTAIDGTEIVMSAARGAHYPVTLEATQETGWIRGSTVASLRAISAVAGAYYTLVLNGKSYIVRFRNEQSGGAIQMETLVPHSNPGDDDWWIGTIYLMCVG
jgi:hypothetical protein